MKRRVLLLAVSLMSIGAMSFALFLGSKDQPNFYQADTSSYQISIDPNSINLGELPGLDGGYTYISKIRYTEFGFDKVSPSSNMNSFILHPLGRIYNLAENQNYENYSITGFKSLSVNYDETYKLTATFSDYEDGIGQTIDIASNQLIDISSYKDYRYICFKAVGGPVDISSIKINYTCQNDSVAIDKEISIDSIKAKLNDTISYDKFNPYDGNIYLYYETIKDDVSSTYEVKYDFDHNKFHYHHDKQDIYVSYDGNNLIRQEINNNIKTYQSVLMSEMMASDYIHYLKVNGNNYYSLFESLIYQKPSKMILDSFNKDNYLTSYPNAKLTLNEIKYVSNGQPGNLGMIANIKIDDANNITHQIKQSVKLNDNLLVSLTNEHVDLTNNVITSTNNETITLSKEVNINTPSLAGFDKVDNLISLNDKYILISNNYAFKKTYRLSEKYKALGKYPISGSFSQIQNNEYNYMEGSSLKSGTALLKETASFDFNNLKAFASEDSPNIEDQRYYAYYQDGDIIFIHEQIADETKANEESKYEYQILKATPEEFKNFILNCSYLNYHSYFISHTYESLDNFVNRYMYLKTPYYFMNMFGRNVNVIKDEISYSHNIKSNSFKLDLNAEVHNCEGLFYNGVYTSNYSSTYKDNLLDITSFDTMHQSSDGEYFYHSFGSRDYDAPISFKIPTLDDKYVVNNSLISHY